MTSGGDLKAAGRVVSGDARDATTPVDGALSTRGGLSVAKGAMVGGRLRVFDNTDAGTAGGGALAVVGGIHVGRGRDKKYCPPRHPMHVQPSFLELNGIL